MPESSSAGSGALSSGRATYFDGLVGVAEADTLGFVSVINKLLSVDVDGELLLA